MVSIDSQQEEKKITMNPGLDNMDHDPEKQSHESNGSLDGSDHLPLSVPKNSDYQNGEHVFDTGLKAWLQVVGAFFLFFNSWGVINTFGAFQTYYEQHDLSSLSPSTIAWIGSVQPFFLLMFGVIIGPLFDAGYFHLLLLFGTFLLTFGLMMVSISSQYWHFMLAQGICVGLAAAALFVPSVTILPQYFKRRRGLVNGLAASGGGIGGVAYPVMFDRLQREIGFAWAVRTLAFVALGTCCISMAVMRMRFRPTEKRALIQLSSFREPQYVLFCIALFLGFLGLYNFLIFVQPYAIETGIVDNNLGFYLLPILNAASAPGRVAPSLLADYVGPVNMLIPAALVAGILAFGWIGVYNAPGIILLSALYGFFSGGFVSLPPVVMMVITPDLRNLGTRLGMLFGIISIALLIGTPIGGAISGTDHRFLGVQLFCGACLLSSAVLLTLLRVLRTGPHFFVRT
ncbi:Major facilitator superfamily domain containing protein [Elaphomyces granulatus]